MTDITNLIVRHLAGSHAYGTNIETSDVDIRGIFVAEPVVIRTGLFPVREVNVENEEDSKFWELNNYVKLYLDGNPNILETLWIDESDILEQHESYSILRKYRQNLLSSKVAFTFTGYALSQMRRMKSHSKWINNPQPVEAPKQKDYLFYLNNCYFINKEPAKFFGSPTDQKLIQVNETLFAVAASKGHSVFTEDGQLIIHEDKELKNSVCQFYVLYKKAAYEEAFIKWQQYWDWKKNRNKVRSDLEEHFGYDTKHVSHLVRLLRMGEEILTTGQVLVKRPDAEELKAIRSGSWTYEEVLAFAEEMDNKVRNVLYHSTDLPKKPDIKLAAKIILDIQDCVWYNSSKK